MTVHPATATSTSVRPHASAARPALRSRVFTAVNLVAAALSTASALIALAAPGVLSGGETAPGVEFYAQAYAARAVPIGLAVFALLLVPALRTRPAALLVLSVAGLAQVGDLAIGAVQGIPGMMAGSAIGAIAHLASAAWLIRAGRDDREHQ